MIARPAPRQTAPVLHTVRGRNGAVIREEWLQSTLAPWEGALTCEEDLRWAETVAIRRDAGLGDCIMLQASWAELKQRMPHLKLTLFCPESMVALFRPDPWLEDVQPYRAFGGGYDVDANLHEYVERHPERDITPRILLFATAFGMEVRRPAPRVYLPEAPGRGEAQVAVAYRSALAHRSWPYAAELIALCRERGWRASLVDREPMPGEPLTGLPLDVLAQELAACDVVVSPDTGIYHLAGALQHYGKARAIAIFGPVDPKLRILGYPTIRYLVSRKRQCVPCHEGPPHMTCRKPGEPSPCLADISAQSVLEYVRAWMT